jgi:anthranilate synthase component 2
MVLLIDNYDSFTYNIMQYCMELNYDIKVIRNDQMKLEQILALNPKKIIISPGPGSPKDTGISLDVIKKLQNSVPILGVCLGHQLIAQYFGANIIRSANIMHGKTSVIIQQNSSIIFNEMPKEFTQTRYHSLIVEPNNLPSDITVTAKTKYDEIMALEIKDKHIYGVQFHPESIMSEYGHKIFNNFLTI